MDTKHNISTYNPLKNGTSKVPPSLISKQGRVFDKATTIIDLLELDWTVVDDKTVEQCLDFIVDLVSSNSNYVVTCFKILIKSFLPIQISKGKVLDLVLSKKLWVHVHTVIMKVLKLVPLSYTCLFAAIREYFPHKRLEVEIQRNYIENILKMTYYCHSLIQSVLSLVVEKLLQIDVDIKLEELPDEDELLFEMEGCASSRTQNLSDAQLLADKLDALMMALFQYLEQLMGEPSNDNIFPRILEVSNRQQVFLLIVKIFDDLISTTYKSKYIQFIIFFICKYPAVGADKQTQTFPQMFVAHLLSKIADLTLPRAVRLVSAAYLGSFVARANYITPQVARKSVFQAMEWAYVYLDRISSDVADVSVHSLFYMVCQAIFYSFCFRSAMITEDVVISQQLSVGLKRIAESPLYPFKICSSTVVSEFCRIAGAIPQFSWCPEVLRKNEKAITSTHTSTGEINQFNSYFPFDPYLLKESSKYIKPIYEVWNIARDEESDNQSDSDADDKSDSSDNDDDNSSTSNSSKQATAMSYTPEVEVEAGMMYHFSLDD